MPNCAFDLLINRQQLPHLLRMEISTEGSCHRIQCFEELNTAAIKQGALK